MSTWCSNQLSYASVDHLKYHSIGKVANRVGVGKWSAKPYQQRLYGDRFHSVTPPHQTQRPKQSKPSYTP
jgi:hypothetical protein